MILDAYTVRKAIPRIVLAVIGINLSIYLCVALVDVVNVVGNGINGLISGPFVGDGIKIDQDSVAITGNLVTAGALTLIIGLLIKSVLLGPSVVAVLSTLLPLVIIAALIALAVLFTLIIRQALVLFLVVISPVAIALFVLPGTEKYFKKWLDLFMTTLMVYPIIAVIFAMSNVMVAILLGEANNSGGADQTIRLLAAIVVLYAPLVLIPFAFKLAGGAISTLMNAAQGVTQKRAGRMQEARARRISEARQLNSDRIKAGQRFKGGTANNWRGRLNRGLQGAAILASGDAGINPGEIRSRMQATKSNQEFEASKKAKESINARPVLVNDDLMEAVIAGDRSEASARRHLESKGFTGRKLDQAAAQIRAARRDVGSRALEIAAVSSLPGTKTAYSGAYGDAEMLSDAVRISEGDRTMEGLIMNEQRTAAQGAGRMDLSGWGFGSGLSAMDAIRDAYSTQGTAEKRQQAVDTTIKGASRLLSQDALTHLSGGQIAAGHSNSVKRLITAANERVDIAAAAHAKAVTGKNPDEIIQTDRELKQALAISANLIDVSGSVGNDSAQLIANGHLEHMVDTPDGQVRISDMVEKYMRTDPVFAQMRREMSVGRGDQELREFQQRTAQSIEGGPPDITRPPGM